MDKPDTSRAVSAEQWTDDYVVIVRIEHGRADLPETISEDLRHAANELRLRLLGYVESGK